MDPLSQGRVSTVDSLLAADAQVSAGLLRDAISGYESALSDTSPLDAQARLELSLKLADCFQKTSQCTRVVALLQPFLSVALAPEWRARTLMRIGWAQLYLGDSQSCVDACSAAVAVLNPTHFHEDLGIAARRLGYALKWQGRLAEAEESFRDALAASKRGPDREQVGLCVHALGNLSRQRGLYRQAIEFHCQSLAINVELGLGPLIAKDLFSIGLSALYAGDWKQAAETLAQSHKMSEELGLARGLLLVDLTLCRLHRRRGESSTAEELAARALARARETSDARAEVLAFEEIGDLAREGGHFPAAAEAYDNGWRIAQSIAPEGDLVYELAWRRALLLLDAGDMEGAEQLAQRALELADRSSDSREAGNALRTLSRIQHRRNCGSGSLASLEAALERARSIQAPYEMAEAHEQFAELASADGPATPTSALAHLFEAQRFYTQLGARAAVARVDREIARFEALILDENVPALETLSFPAPAEDGAPIVKDPGMVALVARATELASADATVLLQGATGTGKEVLARLLHDRGPRAPHPFIALNCAALPAHLLESELFGHRRGSFTGAEQDRAGLFESAGEGTVFLDEIDKASPEFQTKLLRVIEDRRARPVGSIQEVAIHARVLCATNRDLRELVDAGRFLPDLLYRLSAFRLVVPPLRERPDDLWALVDHYLGRAARRFGARRYRLTPEAKAALAVYDWPGNVRELRNVLEAAAFFTRRTGRIDRDDLPAEIAGVTGGPAASLPERIETLERHEIMLALRRARGNKTVAAQALKVSRKGLLDRLRRLGIE